AIPDANHLTHRLAMEAGRGRFLNYPFTRLAEALLGDAIGSNLMMVGAAYQQGWLTLDEESFIAAIKINGVSVELNLAAFQWGRYLILDSESVFKAAKLHRSEPKNLVEIIEERAAFLTAYQDAAYAARFRNAISAVQTAADHVKGGEAIIEAA